MKGQNEVCPICKSYTSEEDECCAHCGQRFKAYRVDAEGINSTEPCPICHKRNRLDVDACIHCGQRFKAYNLDNVKNQYDVNKRWHGNVLRKLGNILLAVILILVITCGVMGPQVLSGIYDLIPQKIIQVNDLENSVNQGEKFDLPAKISAKMEYVGNKAVSVKWGTNTVDTSVSGVKTIQGKIDGYEKTVCFKLTVLPNQIKTSIGNCTVDNSILEIQTNVANKIKWLWFKAEKGGQYKDTFISSNNGAIEANIVLPYGKGDYRIKIFTSQSDSKQGTYYEWKTIEVGNNDTRDMSFLLPDEYVQSDSWEIRNLAYQITEKCVTDMEKTLAIHDWVCANIAYDVNALLNNTVHEYSAIETLKGRKAVCNGYANLTAALNRSIGIRSKVISGTADNQYLNTISSDNGHAWNETYVDGKWIIQDTTWDAGGVDAKTKQFKFSLSHKYFNPEQRLFGQTHTKEKES